MDMQDGEYLTQTEIGVYYNPAYYYKPNYGQGVFNTTGASPQI